MLSAVGAEAKAREVGVEFIVLKRSTSRKKGLKSWTSYRALRDQAVAENRLIQSDQPDYFACCLLQPERRSGHGQCRQHEWPNKLEDSRNR